MKVLKSHLKMVLECGCDMTIAMFDMIVECLNDRTE